MKLLYRNFLPFVIIITVGFSAYGNTQKIDSLLSVSNSKSHDTIRIKALQELGNLYIRSIPDSAFIYFQKAAEISEALMQNDKDVAVGKAAKFQYSLAVYKLATIYYHKGELNKALELNNKSLDISEEIDDKHGMASSLNFIAVIFYVQGEIDKALEYYNRSLEMKEAIGDKLGMANTLINIGLVHRNHGNINRALENFNKSYRINEELGDKRGMAVSLNSIGSIYHNQKEYQKALEFYKKGLVINEEIDHKHALALLLSNIGLVYLELGDMQNALDNYTRSFEIAELIGDKDIIAISLSSLGEIYYKQQQYKTALKFFNDGYKKNLEIGNKTRISTSLVELGMTYLKLNNIAKALEFAQQGYKVSKELNFVESIEKAAALLKDIYEKQGDYKTAFKYYQEEMLMKDSILNEENLRSTLRQQARFEYEIKAISDSIQMVEEKKVSEAKLLARDEQLKRSNLQKIVLAAGIVIALMFSLVMYRNYKVKKEANVLLAEQFAEINQKNEEITSQRDEIETQRDILIKQKTFIENQNKAITDSINYAKRIQQALLPDLSVLTDLSFDNPGISDSFILFKPKEIVSGDFYWANRINNHLIVALADCTGHGVPGGFMSMMGMSFLNEIVNKQESFVASEILNILRDHVSDALKQAGKKDEFDTPILDGINIVLVVIDVDNLELQYSGSYNPLWMIRNSELSIFKTDLTTIGILGKNKGSFTNHQIKLQRGDTFYMFSDGYIDQFDEEGNQRFKYSRFKQLLLSIHSKPLYEQRQLLEETFYSWKGNNDQIDDVTILGFKI
ncbi:MAG: tetratricopeptide repeat protein [Bacteroidetes bacterium]|nr:tetratricopeptide repeat protein [Bacteroidota bacterium]